MIQHKDITSPEGERFYYSELVPEQVSVQQDGQRVKMMDNSSSYYFKVNRKTEEENYNDRKQALCLSRWKSASLGRK